MTKKVCIITGGNAGIGKQAAIQIAKEGYHVIIACRSKERGEKALAEIQELSQSISVELILVDMSQKSSILNFANDIKSKYQVVDVLIHNAAVFDISQKKVELTNEGHETVWMTNHIGPVYLTSLLLDLIKVSHNGRIITISSKGLLAMPTLKIDFTDPEFTNKKFSMTKAYYHSKRAQVMYTYWLANQLKETQITVNCIRVTAVQIDINRHPNISAIAKYMYSLKSKSSITPAEMAKTYTFLATNPSLSKVTGQYFNEKNQSVKSNKYTINKSNINALMELTNNYL